MIGGAVLWTSIFGINQSQVQRYVCCKSKKDASISMVISGIGLIAIMILAGMTGLTIYATYKDCDPISNGQVDKSDQLFPYIIMDVAGHLHGIPGLFVAAVYSSSLSTISSGINAMACVTLEDFIRPVTDWRELTYTRISRVLVPLYGVSYILVAFLASKIGGLIRMSYSIHGILGGPLTAVFTVGMLVSWVNHWGALIGALAGICSTVWLFVGSTYYPAAASYTRSLALVTDGCEPLSNSDISNYSTTDFTQMFTSSSNNVAENDEATYRPPLAEFYSISYLHFATVGFLTTALVSMLISVLTGRTKANPPKQELLSPFMRSAKKENRDSDEPKSQRFDDVGVERSTSWVASQGLSVNSSPSNEAFLEEKDNLRLDVVNEEEIPLASMPDARDKGF